MATVIKPIYLICPRRMALLQVWLLGPVFNSMSQGEPTAEGVSSKRKNEREGYWGQQK